MELTDDDLTALARAIIDANVYMVLGTADPGGRPWVSPVFYAPHGYGELYWISSPDVTHSRNLAGRPEAGIVVFDSRAPVGTGQAVYIAASAGVVADTQLADALQHYPGHPDRGGRQMTPDDLRAPATYRLYRATVSAHSVLCPRESGRPCARHGLAHDHRTAVQP
ncbi:MAG TPA: pyridoxamine 5'-phosphate oxidase family protein [Acidimicrobiales bacterium]|nr:pyridoxamine 5'-phosphate oxidase family protein [Acidimicrobiales bacterium]